jgi:hypothetical protein
MKAIRKTFGLQELFLSTACFAVAAGIICFNNRLEFDPDHRWLFRLAVPMVGALIGAGIGVLVGRRRKCAVIGAYVACIFAMMMWSFAMFYDIFLTRSRGP